MRLAFCLFKYIPYRGLERDFLRIAKACFNAGHEIHVYTMSWQGEKPEKFSITLIPVSALTNAGRAKQFGQQLLSILAKEKYDVVIGFNRMPGLDIYFAADSCYCARTIEKHGPWYRLLPRYHQYQALEKAVFSPVSKTKILLLNPEHKNDFRQYYQTPEDRFEILLPGIGQDRQRPENQESLRDKFRQNRGISPDEKILLIVGSDFKLKGVDRALLAFASLPQELRDKTHLWVVGKGNIKMMNKLSKKLEINTQVKFFGPREDVVDFYAASDCMLHLAYHETAGMVLIEAIVAGLPILVTANCGYAVYVQKAQAGVLVEEPFNQANVNKKLLALLSDQKILNQYRQNALKYAASHDLFHLTERVVEIIEHVNVRQT